MRESKFRYTKLALVNSLLSLIPFVPILTLYPGVFLSAILGKIFNNCELGYLITMWICLAMTIFLIIKLFRRIAIFDTMMSEKQLKKDFKLFSLGIYALLNTALLIIILGPNLACNGDGQSIMVVIYSGPLASFGLLLLGVSADIKTLDTNREYL